MARPREFDETAVLDAAVQCFWMRGYESTSIRDLATGMGITGASLYNAFGDKRGLYSRALDHYVTQRFVDRVQRVSQLPPRQAITAFFDEIIEHSVNDPQRKGCLMVNSAMELAPHDVGFQQAIAATLTQIEAFFARTALAGQQDGSIAITHCAEDLGRSLLALLMGLRVLARARPERELLEGAVRPVLSLLG